MIVKRALAIGQNLDSQIPLIFSVDQGLDEVGLAKGNVEKYAVIFQDSEHLR